MLGEFLLQFVRVIGKGRQDVLSPHTSWLATVKNDLSYHNLSVEDATKLALDRPLHLWSLLAASRAKGKGSRYLIWVLGPELIPVKAVSPQVT